MKSRTILLFCALMVCGSSTLASVDPLPAFVTTNPNITKIQKKDTIFKVYVSPYKLKKVTKQNFDKTFKAKDLPKLKEVPTPTIVPLKSNYLTAHPMSPEEQTLFNAQIAYDNHDQYELALGLLMKLTNSKDPRIISESSELYLATIKKLKLSVKTLLAKSFTKGVSEEGENDPTANLINETTDLYRAGKLNEGLEKMKAHDPAQSPHSALFYLTLGRFYFQKGMYKEAFDAYLKVDKDSSHWLQAIVEQSWAQILSKDYEGAAGNMFTLHTEYFKKSFQPESYLVRTIAYLNLCQYGDAFQVLKSFKIKYSPELERIHTFNAAKSEMDYYTTLKAFLQTPKAKTVNGLSAPLLLEMARTPGFINNQKLVNQLEDEGNKINTIYTNLINSERSWGQKAESLKQKLTNPNLENRLLVETQKDVAQTLYQWTQVSRNGFKASRDEAIKRMQGQKDELKKVMAANIKTKAENIEKSLKYDLNQAEILQYEIYSGASEQLRFQMAGGEEIKNPKDRPELTPKDEQSMKWGFKGEIWEDELGHYRSSLENICPKENN